MLDSIDDLLNAEDGDDYEELDYEREEALLQDEESDVLDIQVEDDLNESTEEKNLNDLDGTDCEIERRKDKFSTERQTITGPTETNSFNNGTSDKKPFQKFGGNKPYQKNNLNSRINNNNNNNVRPNNIRNFRSNSFVRRDILRRNRTVLINPRFKGVVHVNNSARLAWDNQHAHQQQPINPWTGNTPGSSQMGFGGVQAIPQRSLMQAPVLQNPPTVQHNTGYQNMGMQQPFMGSPPALPQQQQFNNQFMPDNFHQPPPSFQQQQQIPPQVMQQQHLQMSQWDENCDVSYPHYDQVSLHPRPPPNQLPVHQRLGINQNNRQVFMSPQQPTQIMNHSHPSQNNYGYQSPPAIINMCQPPPNFNQQNFQNYNNPPVPNFNNNFNSNPQMPPQQQQPQFVRPPQQFAQPLQQVPFNNKRNFMNTSHHKNFNTNNGLRRNSVKTFPQGNPHRFVNSSPNRPVQVTIEQPKQETPEFVPETESPPPKVKIEEFDPNEDEETRAYRLKIEEQKRLREEILRKKEEKRKLLAAQKLQSEEKGEIKNVTSVTMKPPSISTNIKVVSNVQSFPQKQFKHAKPLSSNIVVTNSTYQYQKRNVANVGGRKRVVVMKNNNNSTNQNTNNINIECVADDIDKKHLSAFLNDRKILAKDQSLADTRVVLVKNLSANTTDRKIITICKEIGEVQKLQRDKTERQATILFKSVASAHAFYKKYQRYMLDLSMIEVTLKPMS